MDKTLDENKTLDNDLIIQKTGSQNRRTDIDWIRIFIILLLIPFHTAIIYDLDSTAIFLVPKKVNLIPLKMFIDFTSHWGVPILFLFAGMSIWYALMKRTPKQFFLERLKRLGVPILFGCMFLIPIAVYLYLIQTVANLPTIGAFYLGFITQFGDMTGYDGKFTPGPLWFIIYLFLWSLILLPIFNRWHRHATGRLDRLDHLDHLDSLDQLDHLKKKFNTFVRSIAYFFIPIMLIAIMMQLPSLGGENFFFYGLFMIMGFYFASNPKSQETIDKLAWLCIIIGVCTFILEQTLFKFVDWENWSEWENILGHLNYYTCIWSWIIGIMGIGHKYIHNSGKIWKYLSEASYPIYILHTTVVAGVAFLIFKLLLDPWSTYFLIIGISLIIIFLIYDIMIRRNNIGRFLFGMRLRSKKVLLTNERKKKRLKIKD